MVHNVHRHQEAYQRRGEGGKGVWRWGEGDYIHATRMTRALRWELGLVSFALLHIVGKRYLLKAVRTLRRRRRKLLVNTVLTVHRHHKAY